MITFMRDYSESDNMSDLIININFVESRKKNQLVIESYEGIIPHLKSKKFSGQIRNADISTIFNVNNLSVPELEFIKQNLVGNNNTQISKYQYIYDLGNLSFLRYLISRGCLFYKDIKTGMYQVEDLREDTDNLGTINGIGNFSYSFNKTVVAIQPNIAMENNTSEAVVLEPIMYIDITSEKYLAEVYFDYSSELVRATSKDRVLSISGQYRDYGREKELVDMLKAQDWVVYNKDYFQYIGKDITSSLQFLEEHRFHLYVNNRQDKINVAKMTNLSISYGIDWFTISGDAVIRETKIPLGDLIDFRKKQKNWIQLDGKIIFLPDQIKKAQRISFERDNKVLKVAKSEILDVLNLANEWNLKQIANINELVDFEDIETQLPAEISSILRPYQFTGIKWLLSLKANGFGGCLADDMGLGKTLQIIAYLSDARNSNARALIVVPKTLLENWKREFIKFSPKIRVNIYHGTNRTLANIENEDVIITTYGTLINDIKIFSQIHFENLIVDEVQYIKNSRSKAYRAVKSTHAFTKIIMTGTPVENNLQEYWDLMRVANHTELTFKMISKNSEPNAIFEKVRTITKPFLLRRFKNDVLKELPEKEEQVIFCNFDKGQKALYETMLESIRNEIDRKADRFELKSKSIVLSGLLYLQEICCHPRLIPKEFNKSGCLESVKMDVLRDMVSELYSTGHKIVIFSRFTRMLKLIQTMLAKQNMDVFYLDGQSNNRQSIVDQFEQSASGVFLISLKAGGVGLNLTSADTAIIYDPWWNPAVEKQAEDRIYRIGQKKKVTIYKLIVADSIEEKVQNLQAIKRELFDKIVDGHEMPTNITMKDIYELIGH